MSFGARLRAERERRTITLESIAANTKIGIGLLRALERDDVSRWPGGIFRRAFLRAYAEAIGLDPDRTLREFLEQFPDPETVADGQVSGDGCGQPAPARTPAAPARLADAPQPFFGGPLVIGHARRLGAAATDATAALALASGAFALTGGLGVSVMAVVVGYFFASVLLLGNTPGVCLFARAREVRRVTVEPAAKRWGAPALTFGLRQVVAFRERPG